MLSNIFSRNFCNLYVLNKLLDFCIRGNEYVSYRTLIILTKIGKYSNLGKYCVKLSIYFIIILKNKYHNFFKIINRSVPRVFQ